MDPLVTFHYFTPVTITSQVCLGVKCFRERSAGAREREMDWSNPKPAPGPLALVQDFINTRNHLRGGDLLEDAEAATTWLAGRGLLGEGERIEEPERRLLITFREGLRTLLLARNGGPPPDLELLGNLAAPAALRVRFGSDGRPAIEPGSEEDPAGRVVARPPAG